MFCLRQRSLVSSIWCKHSMSTDPDKTIVQRVMGSITWLKWPDTNLLIREDFPTPGSPTTLTRHTDCSVSNIALITWWNTENLPQWFLVRSKVDWTFLGVVHCAAITVLVLRFLLSHINHLISNWVQRNRWWHRICYKVTAYGKGMIHMMTFINWIQSSVSVTLLSCFFLVTKS